jgi:all-trans-retinol dehydrogenase (NAD+)
MTQICGKRVLITGASSGLGRLLALAVAQRGGRPLLWGRNRQRLQQLADEIRAAGGDAALYCCDLRHADQIETTLAMLLDEQGGVDVLINNAARVRGKRLLELSDEEVRHTFAVNSLALFQLTRLLLPGMLAQGAGHLVTIASAGGLVGTARLTDYCASKFAAVGFHDALRAELRRQRAPLQMTLMCPYYFDSGMFEGVRSASPLLPVLKQAQVARRTIRAIERDEAQVQMPWLISLSWPLRLLPRSWFDRSMDLLGVTGSMDGFVGRQDGS